MPKETPRTPRQLKIDTGIFRIVTSLVLGGAATVPQGTVAASSQQLQLVSPRGEPQAAVSVADLASLVDETSFQQAFDHRRFTQNWKGVTTGNSKSPV